VILLTYANTLKPLFTALKYTLQGKNFFAASE
jgi:hypothetical protein